MKRTRMLAVGATALTTVLLAAPAAIGGIPPEISVDPTSGPIGTVVTVSGTNCDSGIVEVSMVDLESDASVVVLEAVETSEGLWSDSFAVPDIDPAGDWHIWANCFLGGETTPVYYDLVPFDVLEDGTVVTPPDPADPPVVEPSVSPVAAPAVAVAGDPDYTG
jgi:hypothetical protein